MDKTWGSMSYESSYDKVNETYNETVHFGRDIFNIPLGRAGNSFINEFTFWLKQFNSSSNLYSIVLKSFMVLPLLILQKLSVASKAKDHSEAIDRRLTIWRRGDLDLFIQRSKIHTEKVSNIEESFTL